MLLDRIAIIVVALSAGVAASFAQNGENTAPDIVPPPGNCQAAPQDQDGGKDQSSQTDPSHTGSTSLTEKLDPCDGVLKPPPVGDQQMTQPPPATGEMPVIRPDELPQQSNPRQQ